MKEVKGFQCDHCGQLFEVRDDCVEHEDHHIMPSQLEITEVVHTTMDDTPNFNFDNSVGQFPSTLRIENKDWSGYASQYRLEKVGPVEEIYPFDEHDND